MIDPDSATRTAAPIRRAAMRTRSPNLGRGPRPPGVLLWLIVAATAVGTARAAAAGPDDRRLVVAIYPEDTDGSPGTVAADRGIRSTLGAEWAGYVEVRNEYVDTSGRRGAGQANELQLGYLRKKYAGRRVDLVIAVLASGFDFALAHRADLFPGAPVVFCAVDEREVRTRELPADVVGVPMRVDLRATLQTARRLHPGTRLVF